MKKHKHQKYIEGILKRDSKMIQEIYTLFFPAIETYILKNRGSADDAHDVFQEGMQMLYNEVTTKDFRIKAGLNNWFFIVCRNIWYKKLNKKAKSPVTIDEEIDLKSVEDTEEMMIANERKQVYLSKFKQLSEKGQQVLSLFFDHVKMAEIAIKLGYKNANVVKKKKSECQKKLTQLIQSDPLFKELVI